MLFSALSHFFFLVPPLLSWMSIFLLISNLAHIAYTLPRCKPFPALCLLNYENVETFLKLYRYLDIIFKLRNIAKCKLIFICMTQIK